MNAEWITENRKKKVSTQKRQNVIKKTGSIRGKFYYRATTQQKTLTGFIHIALTARLQMICRQETVESMQKCILILSINMHACWSHKKGRFAFKVTKKILISNFKAPDRFHPKKLSQYIIT